jgi:hypothetical protein
VPLPPGTAEHERPVVFVGPFEHHSNLLPWRESCALVVTIPEDAAGCLDTAALRRALASHAHHAFKCAPGLTLSSAFFEHHDGTLTPLKSPRVCIMDPRRTTDSCATAGWAPSRRRAT